MARIQNIVIDQGATFSRTYDMSGVLMVPYDLSAYSIVAQIRRSYSSNSGLSFTAAIVGDPINGSLSISLTAAETATLKNGRYVYDIKLTTAFQHIRVYEGIVTVTPSVTR